MSVFLLKAVIPRLRVRVRVFSARVSEEDEEKRRCFVVGYLKKSLGFSAETAWSVSKHVKFESEEKPEKAIKVLKRLGFTKRQIAKVVKGLPEVLVSETEKSVVPKVEFLKSKGVSEAEAARAVSNFPSFLTSSLAEQIVPSFEGVREFLGSEERTVKAVTRFPHILCRMKCIAANASVLREQGVSESHIGLWLERYPRSLVSNPERFREAAREIREMGFVASKANFSHGLRVWLSLSKATWDSKIRMLRGRGFSTQQLSRLFRSFPNAMTCSEANISRTLDFFMREMGWSDPCSHIASYPSVLGLSLRNRIIPRCSVYKALLRHRLLTRNNKVNLKLLLMTTEQAFFDKFVTPYPHHASDLSRLYRQSFHSDTLIQ